MSVPSSVLSSLSAPISASLAGLSSLSGLSPQTLAAAAKAYREPAPPPALPVLHLAARHAHISGTEPDSCPHGLAWLERGEHVKAGWDSAEEADAFGRDMAVLVRREYDSWVEICWTEAFHHVFTRILPVFVIDLILAHATPQLMRQRVVHGGPTFDAYYQSAIRAQLFTQLEARLSGLRGQAEYGVGGVPAHAHGGLAGAAGAGVGEAPAAHGVPRDGVCVLDLAQTHGAGTDEDDHATCLCQLTCCADCLRTSAAVRRGRGPAGYLPRELDAPGPVRDGWAGAVETEAQARERAAYAYTYASGSRAPPAPPLPRGAGFARIPKHRHDAHSFRPLLAHPQMTDVLAVEEHIRWRLKELGAPDASVEARYGPCTNAPAAMEGLELPDEDEDAAAAAAGAGERKTVEGRVRGKLRKTVRAPVKRTGAKDRRVYLPKTWTEAEPQARHTAVVLTYRHFVNLLHRTAASTSPFLYPTYASDISALAHVHPAALYRRLTEPSLVRSRRSRAEAQAWAACMERWTELLGAHEKAAGNAHVGGGAPARAVLAYSRAISLDPRKTVYYSNRAVAYNALGQHAHADADCRFILARDGKNTKAYYQRALARMGTARWRDAEHDLKMVVRFSEGGAARHSAEKLLAEVRLEIAKLPKQSLKDALDF
ncbi:hypothetical protein Q5752_001847 [Cryptotrichosporon argae]